MPYRNLKEIIEIVTRKPKSLACHAFSKDQKAIGYVLNAISFGGGCVNQTNLHCWIDRLPFDGVGMSGMDKYYVKLDSMR
jgi:aldehyde dehydrogenase (NAD+)